MTYGTERRFRYRGTFIADIETCSLEWILERYELDGKTRGAIKQELRERLDFAERRGREERERAEREKAERRKRESEWWRGFAGSYWDEAGSGTYRESRHGYEGHGRYDSGNSGRSSRRAPANAVSEKLRPAAAAIVEAGYRAMTLKNHPDRGGDTAAMVATNEAARVLRELVGGKA